MARTGKASRTISVWLSVEDLEALDAIAARNPQSTVARPRGGRKRTSRNECIARAIRQYIERHARHMLTVERSNG